MGFDISGALDKGRTLHTVIQLEGVSDGLPLDYYVNRVDDAQKAMVALQGKSNDDAYTSLEQILLSLVASWEATAGDHAVPLTPEGLASVGVTSAFLINLINAIVMEAFAGEAKGTRLQRRSPSY